MTGPTVRVPDSFASASLPPPDLSGAPQITLRDWRSWSDGTSTLAAGCFGTRSASWSPEVTELAEQKLTDVTVGTALRVRDGAGLHVTSHDVDGNVREQRLEGDGVRGRTFLGFRQGEVHACIALCVGARGEGQPREPSCADAIHTSRLEGTFEPPPEPGAGLGALLYAVHHPRPVALAFAAAVVVAGIVSVWRRPRRHRARRF
jgi:hypothetical protein